jgi:hypothetical protein
LNGWRELSVTAKIGQQLILPGGEKDSDSLHSNGAVGLAKFSMKAASTGLELDGGVETLYS